MKIAVAGGDGGLGRAIISELRNVGHDVCCWDLSNDFDVTNEVSLDYKMGLLEGEPRFDILINSAGVNLGGWHESTRIEDWDACMNVNARGPWLVTRQMLRHDLFAHNATIVNITSNAAWKPMRCSAAYNASKAAAHILTLQMARELGPRHGITVFGIAPNKLSGTGMTTTTDARTRDLRGWSKEEADAYQLKDLPAGEETPPEAVADFLEFLLSSKERHKYLQGTIIPYGA